MKKIIKSLSLCLMVLMCAFFVGALTETEAQAASSGYYTSGYWKIYRWSNGTAQIEAYTGSATSVSVPSKIAGYKITNVRGTTFKGNTKIKNVTIPNSISTIGGYLFSGCTSLEKVSLPSGLTEIPSGLYEGCTSMKSITISSKIKTIGSFAFNGCTGLTSITIPNNVTTIKNDAFYKCTNLKTITLSKNLKTIEDAAFSNCESLTSITIPSGVTVIDYQTFWKCTSLSNVTIQGKVTKIGSHAFWCCESLEKITLPNTIKTIENAAFQHTGLKEIILPTSLETIGSFAFSECSNLTSVKMFRGVTSIGENAFYYDKKLNSISIPNTVTSLEEGVFDLCSGLEKISIPCSVTSIGDNVFLGCESLTKIYIPCSVTSVGDAAFNSVKATLYYDNASWLSEMQTAINNANKYGSLTYVLSNVTLKEEGGETYLYRNGYFDDTYCGYANQNGYVETNSKIKYPYQLYFEDGVLQNGDGSSDWGFEGLYKDQNNVWRYYRYGKFQNTTTGFATDMTRYKSQGKIYRYRVEKGLINFHFTGMAESGNKRYYKDGRWMNTYSGKVKINGKTYTIKNGVKK